MEFKNVLNSWFEKNQLYLPWRGIDNPYYIWVSEIILQQTRVAQGLSYYLNFINTFPSMEVLAKVNEDEVLKVWQGLGYYSRARNLHQSAKTIMEKYQGQLPKSYNDLMEIKGIGSYSAGAIASFAYKEVVPAIDGNVYRVIARIFGVFASPYGAKGKKEFHSIVMDIIDRKQPDVFNQALLDFGALQCLPKNPKCSSCPFLDICYANRNNTIDSLPVKAKKLAARPRYFVYVIIKFKNHTFIHKRTEDDIWKSLYQFPLIETSEPIEPHDIVRHKKWKALLSNIEHTIINVSPIVKHQLSHQTLFTRFVTIEIEKIPKRFMYKFLMVENNSVSNYSIPKLIDNYLAAETIVQYRKGN